MRNRPEIKDKATFRTKVCAQCGLTKTPSSYMRSKSIFATDGYLPICNDCIKEDLIEKEFNWNAVDKLCQFIDIPFVPMEFVSLSDMNGDDVMPIYAQFFFTEEYESLDWAEYNKEYKRLEKEEKLDEEIPKMREEKYRKLHAKWGHGYSQDDLVYLENLYSGINATQNVNSALQADQAIKLAKMSLEINRNIENGTPYDKIMNAYDKLLKIAEFTPKNAKNAGDFESIGELIHWLEKRGWVNKFYDDVNRDIVDETIKNIQAFNQRLYINESGIGEQIDDRIKALKAVEESINDYSEVVSFDDLDEFENEGFEGLEDLDEDFDPRMGE